MTERPHFHFSLSCIGEGTGNPLQCSCLENPRDGGAWWAAVYGVAESRTRLKRLSNSSPARSHATNTKECRVWNYADNQSESESRSVISNSLWPHGLFNPGNSPGQNTGVGSLSLLQEIFPSQESNWDLLHCRQILYQLSYLTTKATLISTFSVQALSWYTGAMLLLLLSRFSHVRLCVTP